MVLDPSIKSLQADYLKFFPYQPCDEADIKKIEDELEVHLPSDFKQICTFYSGYPLGYHVEMFNYDVAKEDNEYSILRKTLFWRNVVGLPKKFVALAESEVSTTLLDTASNEVFYISIEDLYNLCAGEPLIYNPVVFATFTKFFEHLLEEEKEERDEETHEGQKT